MTRSEFSEMKSVFMRFLALLQLEAAATESPKMLLGVLQRYNVFFTLHMDCIKAILEEEEKKSERSSGPFGDVD